MELVCFSGGECFLLGDDLMEAIELANNLGLATRCVSNGYWAANGASAERMAHRLRDAGLAEINFSTGDNHAQFVPIESIIHGAAAMTAVGITVAIMVEVTGTRTVTRQTVLDHPLYQEYFGGEASVEPLIEESPWISMDEGQPEVAYALEQVLNKGNLYRRRGCDSILSTIVATPQRDLKVCCGITSEQIPDMRLGTLDNRTIASLYEGAVSDFLKIWLSVDGPERIVAWAAQYYPEIDWENRFAHQCDTCLFMYRDPLVRKAIEEHGREMIPEVLLRYAMRTPARV